MAEKHEQGSYAIKERHNSDNQKPGVVIVFGEADTEYE
jgi:hypothetical protein